MKAKTRKNMLCAFVFGATLFAGIGGIAFSKDVGSAKAESSGAPVMRYGASVRYAKESETNGLRFSATVAAGNYNENATYGMLIAPEDYVKAYPLTAENVFGENAVYDFAEQSESGEWIYTGNKKRIINISYTTLESNADGNYEINGSILNIQEENINRNFVGRAYACVGGTYTMAQWASKEGEAADIANNTRSMRYVANACILSGAADETQKADLESAYMDKCYEVACDTSDYIATNCTGSESKISNRQKFTSDLPEGCDKAYAFFAQYGEQYNLFENMNLADYVRLKFLIKGAYILIRGWTVYELPEGGTAEWLAVICEKQSNGKWTINFNGVAATDIDNPFIGLSGNYAVSALYGVKDPAISSYTVIYKDENNRILASETVRKGEEATYISYLPEDEDLGNGYMRSVFATKWNDADGKSIDASLKNVQADLVAYRSSESVDYVTVTAPNDKVSTYNSLITPTKEGNVVYYFRSKETTHPYILYNGWTDCYSVEALENVWYKVVIDVVNKKVAVYDLDGTINGGEQSLKPDYTTNNVHFYNDKVTDLGAERISESYKSHKVTYKDAEGNDLFVEEVKSGSAAAYKRADETTADGYTVTYENKWEDSEGNEVNIASVTSDITVYYAGEKLIYKRHDKGEYLLPKSINEKISTANGITTFKLRFYNDSWTSFTLYQGKTYSHWDSDKLCQYGIDGSQNPQWFTVIMNANDKNVTVIASDGTKKTGTFTGFNAEEITICCKAADFDIAAVENVKKPINKILVYSNHAENVAPANNGEEKAFRYAVTELETLFREVTGAALSVEYVSDLSALDNNDENYFLLGYDLAEKNGFSLAGLTTETGYIIRKDKGNVYLYGKNGYGTLNAVYALLKQTANLEFYTGTDYTYEKTPFRYGEIRSVVFNPSVGRNWASGSLEDTDSSGNPDWAHWYRLGYVNSWQIVNGGYHNHLMVLPYETYGASHPEWYTSKVVTLNGTDESGRYRALNLAYGLTAADGKKMATAVADYIGSAIAAQAAEGNEKDQFYFGQEDNYTWSDSDLSRALKNKYGTFSAESILFINKVAAILEEKYPLSGRKVRLVMMAYNQTLEAPDYEKFKDELAFYNGNSYCVGVMFAPVESNLYRAAEDAATNGIKENYGAYHKSNAYYAAQLKEWNKFAEGRISVFYYSAHYDNYFVPLDSIANMASKYRMFAENGVTDLTDMGQLAGGSEYTDWNDLKLYMKSKYAENAYRTDEAELIRNFCNTYYGNARAGELMYNFYMAERAQYKFASDMALKACGSDATGCHLIRDVLFDKKFWSANGNESADLLKGWCESLENALRMVNSESEYAKRIRREGIAIRYLLVGLFGDMSYGTMTDIIADAKECGITKFAEGIAYTFNGYGEDASSGLIDHLQ